MAIEAQYQLRLRLSNAPGCFLALSLHFPISTKITISFASAGSAFPALLSAFLSSAGIIFLAPILASSLGPSAATAIFSAG